MKKFLAVLLLVLLMVSCKKDFTELDTETFAHAGESIYNNQNAFPPNTLQGVSNTLANTDVEGIEVDVQMTSDSVLLMFHDATLDENSSLEGCVNNQTWAELKNGTIYNSSSKIQLLSETLHLVVQSGVKILLDVKHSNMCSDEIINLSGFNNALNEITSDLSVLQKELIIVNSRSLDLLNALTDSTLVKSLESDDIDFALPAMREYGIELLAIKLSVMNQAIKDSILLNGFELGIYNIKTRTDNNKALKFAPDFVISDKIEFTLKSIHG